MDESAQQAVQLAVNVTIFVIALTVSIALMIGVRDVAELASKYNASIPTGSRVVNVESQEKRTIKGYEILSYYSNYMNEVNGENIERYEIIIEDGTSKVKAEDIKTTDNLKQKLKSMNISLHKEYEVVTEKYDKNDDILYITIKSID